LLLGQLSGLLAVWRQICQQPQHCAVTPTLSARKGRCLQFSCSPGGTTEDSAGQPFVRRGERRVSPGKATHPFQELSSRRSRDQTFSHGPAFFPNAFGGAVAQLGARSAAGICLPERGRDRQLRGFHRGGLRRKDQLRDGHGADRDQRVHHRVDFGFSGARAPRRRVRQLKKIHTTKE
jgi:hypothetical protein